MYVLEQRFGEITEPELCYSPMPVSYTSLGHAKHYDVSEAT